MINARLKELWKRQKFMRREEIRKQMSDISSQKNEAQMPQIFYV
jgi:hypothetical protein